MSKIPCHARTAACMTALLLIGPGLSACGGGSSDTSSTAAKAPASAQEAGTPARTTGAQTTKTTTPTGKLASPTPPAKPSKSAPARKAGRALTSNSFAQALSRFAACLRRQGVKIPAPNTSGRAPVFSTKGVNTHSRAFLAATSKCRQELLATLRRQQSKLTKR